MPTNATRLRPRIFRKVASPSKTKPFVVTRDQHCQDLRSRPPHAHPKAPARQTIPKIFGILRPSPHQGPPKVKTLFTMSKNQTQKQIFPPNFPVPYGSPPEAQRAKGGGADRDRTGDLKLAKLALSQLSYGPDPARRHLGRASEGCQEPVHHAGFLRLPFSAGRGYLVAGFGAEHSE